MDTQRYGRYTILDSLGYDTYRCLCDCGAVKTVHGNALRTGRTVSCGCFNREALARRNTKHGMYTSKFYYVWRSMKARCQDSKCKGYKSYGGRGITVCERWLQFENFKADMFSTYPGEGWSIERDAVDGPYEPENCRWLPRKEQLRNKRNTVRLKIGQRFNLWTVLEGPLWGIKPKQGAANRTVCARKSFKGRIFEILRLFNSVPP
jgi:hypothetical protein